MTLPTHPEQFDKRWLAARIAPDADTLNGFTFAAVGTGQVADSFRITLDWANPHQMPKSLIAKCPALDPTSRAAGQSMDLYSREVSWYQKMAHRTSIRVPRCYYAEILDNHIDFVLLLEDIAPPAKQIDQLLGCSAEQVGLALSELARLHSFRWNDSDLGKIDWLNQSQDNHFTEDFLPKVYPQWRARYEGRLDPDILNLGADFIARLSTYFSSRHQSPLVVLHNDFRLDNMLFVDADGRPVILDWQTLSLGNPMTDVAYCISTSFRDPQERGHSERDLLRLYLDQLSLPDSADYGFDSAWREYRLAAFVGIIMAVASAMLVERTERGDEMFAVMAERSGYQALELNSLALL